MQKSVIAYVEDSINANWNLPALTDYQGETWYYRDVAEKIEYWHQVFEQCSIKKDDKIALFGKNSANWGIAYVSALTYGAVVVPILPDFSPENVHHIFNHSDSTFLFADTGLAEKLDPEQMDQLEAFISLDDFSIFSSSSKSATSNIEKVQKSFSPESKEGQFKLEEMEDKESAALIYTSGTTGFSKGVLILHESLNSNIQYARENMPLESADPILSFLPLAHAFAGAFEFLFPFTRGCHITFLKKMPTPTILLKAFSEVKPRLIFFVPLILEKIYKKKLMPLLEKKYMKLLTSIGFTRKLIYKKIRDELISNFGGNFIEVVVGGAALNEEVQQFLLKIGFPFTIGYGMTECGPLISYIPHEKFRLNSVGKVVDRMEATIDSKDPENTVGEILVRGTNVMDRYYKNETATKETIDEDGWLHTGDLGLIDNDGHIYIKGRSKNVIVGPSGQNIYPEEIEAKVNNLPYVQESLVIEKNDKLFLLVHPDLDASDADQLDESGIEKEMNDNLKKLNKELPKFMQLSGFKLYPEEFEKTPTKKIKRYFYTTE